MCVLGICACGIRSAKDGLLKLVQLRGVLLKDDATGEIESPIVWAATREPFIEYLRGGNALFAAMVLAAMGVGGALGFGYNSTLGRFVFGIGFVDLAGAAICEVCGRCSRWASRCCCCCHEGKTTPPVRWRVGRALPDVAPMRSVGAC